MRGPLVAGATRPVLRTRPGHPTCRGYTGLTPCSFGSYLVLRPCRGGEARRGSRKAAEETEKLLATRFGVFAKIQGMRGQPRRREMGGLLPWRDGFKEKAAELERDGDWGMDSLIPIIQQSKSVVLKPPMSAPQQCIQRRAAAVHSQRTARLPAAGWALIGVTGMVLAAIGCSLAEGDADPAPVDDQQPSRHVNRLARETSPYLLAHAHNPVDWYPWGPEALEKARKEDKPIFLSIGYSSCHWCHVMEKEVFSDPEIARYMNEHFVNIKVDREERPDVDDIYMTALQMYFEAIGSPQTGGWPLSMFLTPDGRPLGGGTYFPADDSEGRVGFPSLLKKVFESWRDKRKDMESNADILASAVRAVARPRAAL